MNTGLAWRLVTVIGSTLLAFVFLLPSVVSELPAWWKGTLPSDAIHLGLDLRGGIHMVMEVQVDRAVENSVDLLIDQLKTESREKEIATRNWRREGLDTLSFEVVTRSRAEELETMIADTYQNLEKVDSADERRRRYRLLELEVDGIRTLAVDQALETIRNRVDEFGVSEPTIQRSGSTGILIQLPGVDDPERVQALIGRTAQLRFQLVADDPSAPGIVEVPGHSSDGLAGARTAIPYFLEPTVLMSGEVISDARHRPGQFGETPYVGITLNGNGAATFERITGDSVGRQLAIVLDGKVQSAPVIQERIGGGRAVITGNFTMDEARDLAIVLRAGALPAPITIAEERTVGPSLGRDSIAAGTRSFTIGGALVVIFMVFYYRATGLIAASALIVNVLMLMAVLAGFQATLTLPGIAGIVLTLGMAVDANVLINERIREELREGQHGLAAVDSGYSRALPAILDSNATTFLAGLILFQFGSGPIKGFALTLCIGIVTTVFTAVFCSRTLHDVLIGSRGRELSI